MAGPDIDQIGVKLTANTDPLAKGLTRGEGLIGRFGKRAKAGFGDLLSIGKKMTMVGAGVAAGVLAAGTAMTKSSMESIDALAKTADKLGMTTEELGGLRFAAEQTGVGVNTMDMALQRMTRRVAEAAAGTGEAKDAIKLLGLDAKELNQQSPAETLADIADAMQGVKNPSDQLRLAFKLFDSEGAALVNTLAGGREGLEDLMNTAQKLGMIPTPLEADRVEAANDAMNRASKVIEGVGNQLAINLSPFIEVAADKFTEMATSGEGVGSKVFPALKMVGKGIGIVADVVDVLRDGFRFLQAGVTKGLALQLRSWEMVGKGIESVVNMLPGVEVSFTDTLGAMADELDTLASEQWENAKDEFNKPPPSEGIGKFFDDVQSQADEAAKRIAESKAEADKFAKTLEEIEAQTRAFDEMKKFAAGVEEGLKSPLDNLQEEIAKIEEAGALGLLESPAVQKAIENARSKFTEGLGLEKSPLDELQEKAGKLQEAFGAGLIDESEFEDAIAALEKDAIDAIDIESKKDEQGPAGLSRGTAEAFKAIVSSQNPERPMEALKRNSEQGLVIQRETNSLLRDIKRVSVKQSQLKQAKIGS